MIFPTKGKIFATKIKAKVFPAKTLFKHCTESEYKHIFSNYLALSERQLKWDIVNRS